MVNKNTLTSVISKYYLGGLNNQVKWRIKDNTLTVYAGDNGRVCKVQHNNFNLEDAELGVFDTHKLSKLISITSGELNISLEKIKAIYTKMHIADLNNMLITTTTDFDGDNVCEFVFGDNTGFSNKITYQLRGNISKSDIQLPFDSDVFKDILNANKDMNKGTLKVSEVGMLKLNFSTDETESEYFIARNE